jgi:hypothetical protein
MLCRFAVRLGVSPLALLPTAEEDAIGTIAIGSRAIAQAVALLTPLTQADQQRMVEILRLAITPGEEAARDVASGLRNAG